MKTETKLVRVLFGLPSYPATLGLGFEGGLKGVEFSFTQRQFDPMTVSPTTFSTPRIVVKRWWCGEMGVGGARRGRGAPEPNFVLVFGVVRVVLFNVASRKNAVQPRSRGLGFRAVQVARFSVWG